MTSLDVWAADAAKLAEQCARLQENTENLLQVCESVVDGASGLGVVLELGRLQQACLPEHHIFTKEHLRSKKRVKASTVRKDPVPKTPGKENAIAASRRRKSMHAASAAAAATPGDAARKRRAFALEEFREKLPTRYRTEEGVETLLSLRRFLKERAEHGGATLADVRKHMDADLPLMKVSQYLEVLTRLGYAKRENPKGSGMVYLPGGPKKRRK